MTLLVLMLVGTLGWLRWTATPDPGPNPGLDLRHSQVRSKVIDAARLFRYQKGTWPSSLGEMVRSGQLTPSILVTVDELGWEYELNEVQDTFTFGT